MPFNIQRFHSEATVYGFIRPAHFLLAIPSPPKWYSGGDTQFLSYMCSAASLPGTQVITSEERPMGYGPAVKKPYDIASTDITLTFYCDGNGATVSFFDNWLRNIVAFGNPSANDPLNGASYGEVQYPEQYECLLQLYVYNESPGRDEDSSVEILKYSMGRAYPVSMSDVQMDWSNGDSIATFTVTFTYQTFYLERNSAAFGDYVSRDGGYLDLVRGLGSFDSANDLARQLASYAESISSGVIGSVLSSVVGKISNVSASISDKLNAVKGFLS